MANVDNPSGFKVIGHLTDAPVSGCVHAYVVPASDGTALYLGDVVKSGGTMAVDSDGKYRPTVTRAAAGDTMRGIVVGFKSDYDNLDLKYRVANTLRTVFVADDPYILCEAQEDGDTTPLAAVDMGENVDIIYTGTGSSVTGQSICELDSTTHTSSSAQFRLYDFKKPIKDDNEIGAWARWIVMPNEHELKSTSGV